MGNTSKHVVAHIGPGGRGFVEIDGKRVTNCTGISVDSGAGFATTVTLTLNNVTVDLDLELDEYGAIRAETTNIESENKEYADAVLVGA